MNYNTTLDQCDDTVEIVIPTRAQLVERLAAITKWFPEKASGYSKRAKESMNIDALSSGSVKVLTGGAYVLVKVPLL